MSGFFESLAARARGDAPAVRPRLPGMFEAAAVEGFEQTKILIETAWPEPAAPAVAPPVVEARAYRKAPDRPAATPVPTSAAEPPQPATSASVPAAAAPPVVEARAYRKAPDRLAATPVPTSAAEPPQPAISASVPAAAAPPVVEAKAYREAPDRLTAAPAPALAAALPAVEAQAYRKAPDRLPTAPAPQGVPLEVATAPSRSVPTALPPQPMPSRERTPPPTPPTAQATPDRGRRDGAPPDPTRPEPRPRDEIAVRAASVTPPWVPPAAPTPPPPRLSPHDITMPLVAHARPAQPLPVSAPRQEETTVHVSIGRIEVRAVQPPDAKPRERAKSAVMSLDEYLRSRRER